MKDSLDQTIQQIKNFRDERDWQQFHTPENLAKSIVIEAAELLENFQWDGNFDADQVADELADVMNYCLLLSDAIGMDVIDNIHRKLQINEEKYPVEKAKGSSKKYTEL